MKLVLDAIELQRKNRFYGPWALVYGAMGAAELDCDFPKDAEMYRRGIRDTVRTNRKVIAELGMEDGCEGVPWIQAFHRVDYREWPDDRVALVQLTADVVRAVEAMSPRVVPWKDGYMVCCSIVPHFRKDYWGNAGVVDAQQHDRVITLPDEADVPAITFVTTDKE